MPFTLVGQVTIISPKQNHFGRSIMKSTSVVRAACAAAVLLLSCMAINAQKSGKNPSPPRNVPPVDPVNRDLRDREIRLNHIGDEAKAPPSREQLIRMKEIKEDFEHMQQINNELMRAVS